MDTLAPENLSPQVSPDIIAAIRRIAENEGRPLHAVLDEALREYVERKDKTQPRRHVLDAFAESLETFDTLYRRKKGEKKKMKKW